MNAIGNEIVIPGLAFLSITAIGASILASRAQEKKTLEARLQKNARMGLSASASRKKKSGLLKLLEKVGNLASHGHASTSLWEQLIRAGYFSTAAPAIYTGIKMLLLTIGVAGTAILVLPMELHIATKVALISIGGAVLFFIPNIIIIIRLKKHHDEICQHLPEAIDLLEICVSS